jgi:hypothetical protein
MSAAWKMVGYFSVLSSPSVTQQHQPQVFIQVVGRRANKIPTFSINSFQMAERARSNLFGGHLSAGQTRGVIVLARSHIDVAARQFQDGSVRVFSRNAVFPEPGLDSVTLLTRAQKEERNPCFQTRGRCRRSMRPGTRRETPASFSRCPGLVTAAGPAGDGPAFRGTPGLKLARIPSRNLQCQFRAA